MITTNTLYIILLLANIIIVVGIIVFIRNNANRKRTNQTDCTDEDSLYLALYQKSFDPILIIRDNTFVSFNEAALKYIGYTHDYELRQKQPHEISPLKQPDGKNSKEKADEMIMLANRNGNHKFEWEHLSKQGESLFVEVSLTVISIKNEKYTYVVWRDLKDKKEVESNLLLALEKAEESDRLKSAFLESISHEIRTPMNAIIGFAQLLNYETNSRKDVKEFVNYINKSGNSLLLIIDNILDVSSLKSGVLNVYESKLILNELFKRVMDMFDHDTHEKDIAIVVDNKEETRDLIILTDGARLRKTLFQLVNNAIKFTEKGNITFGCFQNGDFLEFFVHDTGIGISDLDKDFVFNVFRKGSFKGEKLYGGTGLGLSIAKASIESMGGKIWLKSEEGIGTEVHFSLPFKLYSHTS